jgi:hypothetical protein
MTARVLLKTLAGITLGGAACYWWMVQSTLAGPSWVAGGYTLLLTVAPPALVSFLVPSSPAGMLLQKINARTWGHAIVLGMALYLVYYSFEIQYIWWSAQPTTVEAGLVLLQTVLGLVGFIVIPALLWSPVSTEELVEQFRQAHLVQRYKLQTDADLALLRAISIRGQELRLKGMSAMTPAERVEYAQTIQALVWGIDETLDDIALSVQHVSGAQVPLTRLQERPDITQALDQIAQTLT